MLSLIVYWGEWKYFFTGINRLYYKRPSFSFEVLSSFDRWLLLQRQDITSTATKVLES